MENIGNLIKAERERRGWSQERLAREVGISQPAVRKIESGQTKKSKYLSEITEKLGIRLEHQRAKPPSLGAYRPPPQMMDAVDDMPVYASAEGGDGALIVSVDELERVPRPYTLKGITEAYAILVTGESMVPAYEPGDRAWVNPRLPPMRDCDCVLYAPTSEAGGDRKAMIKRLVGWTDKEWIVKQYNPAKTFKLDKRVWSEHHRVVGLFRRT